MSPRPANSLYGALGLAMLLFVAASALLVGSSFIALERVRADLAATSSLGKERLAYQMIYTASHLERAEGPARAAATDELRRLMARNERLLASLANSEEGIGLAAANDPAALTQLEQARQQWLDEVRPGLESVMASAPLSRGALDELDPEIRAFAARLDGLISRIEQAGVTRLQRSQLLQFGFSALALLLLLHVLRVVRRLARRTRALAVLAEKVSAGDLAQKASVEGSDELAVLGDSFNAMTARLAGMIDNERGSRERLEKLLATISETAQHLSSSAAEILAGTTQQVEGMREQSSAVAQTVTSVDEVLQTSEQAAQRAQHVAASYDNAVKISNEGRRALDDTVQVMNAVSARTETIAADILSLAENSLEIGEIVSVVAEIADQTNLLALNAAIEASRAGEHGRGFNVVASEIRTLADQSKSATTRVRRILMEIQKSTNSAVIGAEDGSKSVSRALETVSEAGETIRQLEAIVADSARSVAQIAASAGQQRAGMKQIHEAMHYIEQTSSQNLSAIRQAEEAAKDLNELGSRLKEMLTDHGNEHDNT
ncbi:methyl-accepting chemotaxis protein [Sinorhizobium meliloti]|uniref:methyl-accepting chemotaxis protein n=1 Tax=Rhizobium meliloti TaxID=382 RepID=UPI0013E3E798|nr:methyl-accepting chemotaxis protein [Sinorhizobium meliloti]MCO6424846.1 methyl-accepting chemotaxis protein [Sinorhizobium meliloti]MDE3822691.1 methyl-accepting chemotaxis protein [Sinorhizobium meliloti]QND30141.1 methyl-accepting chemotaxis protein [Sinorhizobium meliloti]QPI28563.1 methyl-accepting chemotaxis protein [Sinorhizobium meliloti]WGI76377.1 methyl-accepting chemotaxis protein [Sinorhizobium meliloti]